MPNPIQKLRSAAHSIVAEMKKCTWPTRDELKSSTVVVIICVFILSVFVALADWVSQLVIRLVTVTL